VKNSGYRQYPSNNYYH